MCRPPHRPPSRRITFDNAIVAANQLTIADQQTIWGNSQAGKTGSNYTTKSGTPVVNLDSDDNSFAGGILLTAANSAAFNTVFSSYSFADQAADASPVRHVSTQFQFQQRFGQRRGQHGRHDHGRRQRHAVQQRQYGRQQANHNHQHDRLEPGQSSRRRSPDPGSIRPRAIRQSIRDRHRRARTTPPLPEHSRIYSIMPATSQARMST